MVKENIDDLSFGSHKIVTVVCDSQVSSKCRKEYLNVYKNVFRYRKNNNGRDLCIYCSRSEKHSGRSNPNCKYPLIDDTFFDILDSSEKAYILGWIGSDGHISSSGFIINIHNKDKYILNRLNKVLNSGKVKTGILMSSLLVNSKHISEKLKYIFNLPKNVNKKSDIINFPKDLPEEYLYDFLRGYFDGDGSIRKGSIKRNVECAITSNSMDMLLGIQNRISMPSRISGDKLVLSGVNALDFLGKLYDKETYFSLERKKKRYLYWTTYNSVFQSNKYFDVLRFDEFPICKYQKLDSLAVAPAKKRISDSGFDLTVINLLKKEGVYYYYDTGLQIIPQYGWYFDVIPRSSIVNSGYILANSVGVLDSTYRGSVKIVLIKIDASKPDLDLPSRVVQIVPRPIIHPQMIEISKDKDSISFCIDETKSLDFLKYKNIIEKVGFIMGGSDNNTVDKTISDYETERGDGGFGSTGK